MLQKLQTDVPSAEESANLLADAVDVLAQSGCVDGLPPKRLSLLRQKIHRQSQRAKRAEAATVQPSSGETVPESPRPAEIRKLLARKQAVLDRHEDSEDAINASLQEMRLIDECINSVLVSTTTNEFGAFFQFSNAIN